MMLFQYQQLARTWPEAARVYQDAKKTLDESWDAMQKAIEALCCRQVPWAVSRLPVPGFRKVVFISIVATPWSL